MTTTKTIKEIISNGNSSENQTIKQQFVSRDVYCNVGSLVEACLSSDSSESPVTYDEIENLYVYPEYYGKYANFAGGTEDQREQEIERLKELWNENDAQEGKKYDDICEAIQNEIDELESIETEPQEIFEWWAVSSYLFEKLQEQGEPVIDAGSCYVWGRTTTGQAILLDYCITKICAEMEILHGQSNEWK